MIETDEEMPTEEMERPCQCCAAEGVEKPGRYGYCPYSAEIHQSTVLCICCDDCNYKCLMDI